MEAWHLYMPNCWPYQHANQVLDQTANADYTLPWMATSAAWYIAKATPQPTVTTRFHHPTIHRLSLSATILSVIDMRFTNITLGLVAFLTASAVAAPTASTNDIAKRMPTPEQFEALAPEEKREAYKAIYRATNIIGKSDAEKRAFEKIYRATNIIGASDAEKRDADKAIYRPFEFRVTDEE